MTSRPRGVSQGGRPRRHLVHGRLDLPLGELLGRRIISCAAQHRLLTPRIKAFLDGVDVKDMVVFDMNSEYVCVSPPHHG